MAAMQPEFEDESPIDPFDLWHGANFKLKAKNVAGYRNYDSSEFAQPSSLNDDDEALEALWKKEYSLQDFVGADQFKSYDDLKKRLTYVLGNSVSTKRLDEEVVNEEETSNVATSNVEEQLTASSTSKADFAEDDTLQYFAALASE